MDLELNPHKRAEPTIPDGACRLALAAPAEQPAARVETCKLVTLIGSRRDCDLSISHSEVSKTHCALVNTGEGLIAADLSSRCGTFINGQAIAVSTLHPGDQFRVGPVTVDVQFIDPRDGSSLVESDGIDHHSLETPVRLDGPEGQFELLALPAVIGRRKACQVVLDTPDVSLAHALLFMIQGSLAIFDLGSRSGTYVNGERVTLTSLREGDELCIGGEKLRLLSEGMEPVEREVMEQVAAEAAVEEVVPAETVSEEAVPAIEIGEPDPAPTVETDEPQPIGTIELSDLADLGSMVESLKAQVSASEERLRQRAAFLDQREAELKAWAATLEQERNQLAIEKQQIEKQVAELKASASNVEQDRARLAAERAKFEQERAKWQQQDAERDKKHAELRKREESLDERYAALIAAEEKLAKRQAAVVEREVLNADAARKIEQFKEALTAARQAFAGAPATPGPKPEPGKEPAATKKQTSQPHTDTQRTVDGASVGDGLPAPFVNEPLFGGMDAIPPEQWPEEWQERFQALRRASGKSDGDVRSQVLAEFRAQQTEPSPPSNNGQKKRRRSWLS